MYKPLIISLLTSLFLSACKPPEQKPSENIDFSKGILIVNEGNFMSNNGSISHYDSETNTVTNNIFSLQNSSSPLGDVVQSIAISGDKTFIVANNSRKVEVVDSKTFKHVTTITGFSYPRYIVNISDTKLYLTNGQNEGKLYCINSQNFTVTDSVSLNTNPENLILINNFAYITNGSWGKDSTISVVNISDNQLVKTIIASDGATDLVEGNNNNFWVLCQGKVIYDENWNVISETVSKIVEISSLTHEIISKTNIGKENDDFFPSRIAINSSKNTLYYIEKEGVYKFNTETKTSELIITGDFYGLEVNPKNDNIYTFDAKSFVSQSIMSIYDASGNLIEKDIKLGIGANGAIFQ